MATAFLGARDAIGVAEAAAKSGVHPQTVIKFIEAAAAIALESGIGMTPGNPSMILSRDILDRGNEVAREAVDSYVPRPGHEPFPYFLPSVRDRLDAKIEHFHSEAGNVTPSEQNAESETPAEYGKYGLAAHPATDETGEEEHY